MYLKLSSNRTSLGLGVGNVRLLLQILSFFTSATRLHRTQHSSAAQAAEQIESTQCFVQLGLSAESLSMTLGAEATGCISRCSELSEVKN